MKVPLSEAITILTLLAAMVASFTWTQSDVAGLDKRVKSLEDLKLERVDWELQRTRCDVKTIKALVKSQPEPDC